MFQQLHNQALRQARMVKVMATSGVIRPYNPVKLARLSKTLLDWGIGFSGGIGALAIRSPQDVGLIDELGELTWSEIDDRATRLAHGLKEVGVSSGDSVALLCRNHATSWMPPPRCRSSAPTSST